MMSQAEMGESLLSQEDFLLYSYTASCFVFSAAEVVSAYIAERLPSCLHYDNNAEPEALLSQKASYCKAILHPLK